MLKWFGHKLINSYHATDCLSKCLAASSPLDSTHWLFQIQPVPKDNLLILRTERESAKSRAKLVKQLEAWFWGRSLRVICWPMEIFYISIKSPLQSPSKPRAPPSSFRRNVTTEPGALSRDSWRATCRFSTAAAWTLIQLSCPNCFLGLMPQLMSRLGATVQTITV